ncbi:MAG: hypothetical protein JNK60_21750 [Acidobacteria bacterium]|nr:hypothetical protein [Acidobacteriota bacterium]
MAWTTGVFGLALAIFAVIGLVDQRRMVLDLETSQAVALLGHLAGMPEFQNDRRVAEARLVLLQPSMRTAGGVVRLTPLGAASGVEPRAGTLARWPLSLAGQPFELRYESDGKRLAALMRRTALVHALHGTLSIGALLFGLWWILGRNLVAPLREISRAIDRMRAGSGWQFVVPQTDAELSPLVRAVAELGPGLEQQVYQWITAERRAAVATVLSSIKRGSAEPMSRLDAAIVESEASAGSAEERVRFSALRADLGAVREALEREERYQLSEWTRLGRASVHAGSKRPAGGPGSETTSAQR